MTLHLYPYPNPFWFETTRKNWQNATQMGGKSLFDAQNASFRSLGLVFAFCGYQRMNRARDLGACP
jgi:hypothetical protein